MSCHLCVSECLTERGVCAAPTRPRTVIEADEEERRGGTKQTETEDGTDVDAARHSDPARGVIRRRDDGASWD